MLDSKKFQSSNFEELHSINMKEFFKFWDQIDFSPKKLFLDLFEEQVKKNALKPAACTVKTQISYEELDKKSDDFSLQLKKYGVNHGDFVGLCLSTEIAFLISILGILKAGAVYVPLDPTYPKDRLELMLNDSNPSIIITSKKFSPLFQDMKWKIANIRNFNKASQANSTPLKNLKKKAQTVAGFDDLAYVVYTSGSTGKPKGIMVSHRSLPNIFYSRKSFYPKNFKGLISGGVCFDASLLIIFYSLMSGGCLYLCEYNKNKNVQNLRKFIEVHGINYMICVPSLYEKLLGRTKKFKNINCVSLTGEIFSKSLCFRHAKYAPKTKLLNEYGPTEYAIGTTIAILYSPKCGMSRYITAGQAIANTGVLILDENLNPQPPGVKGEICITGVGLAKGYLNMPEFTEEKFTSLHFGSKIFRIYRTGDLGRFLSNGDLEFLGRVTNQIQINNSLVNLSEVELAMCQYKEIKNAVVLMTNTPKGKKLVSYIVANTKKPILDFIKIQLAQMLPNLNIPIHLIQIEKFPLSPNGKIDRELMAKCTIQNSEISTIKESIFELSAAS